MTWRPDDSELDDIARSLPPSEPAHDRGEQARTALLASAATQRQVARRSMAPVVFGGVFAAAAIVVWLVVRPSAPAGDAQVVIPLAGARYERLGDARDTVIRLDDGTLALQIAPLGEGERFRVKTADAEVEVRGTRFEVAADQGRLALVAVQEGRVEVRVIGQQVVLLAAGERWVPAKLATRDPLVPVKPADVVNAEPAPDPLAPERKPTTNRVVPARIATTDARKPTTNRAEPIDTSKSRVATDTKPPVEPAKQVDVVAPKPGEAEFRTGMGALRGGDARAAHAAFAKACAIAQRDALGEDACFWAGAAAKRAGDANAARAALAAFLRQFPSSARAGEAAALLGWITYDGGDLDAAEQLFHRAEHDRVPSVRDSAQRGLTAIARKR